MNDSPTAEDLLQPSVRWRDAVEHAQHKVHSDDAARGKNSATRRWRRAIFYAKKLVDPNRTLAHFGVQNDGALTKDLEAQHWLELVDVKHRYGTNLKWYHARWLSDPTTENFFWWLDHGEGERLSLNECPRPQLERETILFLSLEQRLNYLVRIDHEGKLRWIKNDRLVDTSSGRWKDIGHGGGIQPSETSGVNDGTRNMEDTSSPHSPASIAEEAAATHYVFGYEGKSRISRIFKRNFTIRGLTNKLLRKTIRRNTWIYVADRHFNLFIGIKETGSFQHSSFLSGGLVTSAGLISVKEGIVHTLSPLSGHYRTSVEHFHRFIDVMTARGMDMKKVRINKAEFALWGIEHLAKLKTIGKKGKGKLERS